MKKILFVMAAALTMASLAQGAESQTARIYESEKLLTSDNPIDALVLSPLREKGIDPAPICSDDVFIRRVYIDVIGTLPSPMEIRSFQEDDRPNKRAILINFLLKRDEFADYWAMKWCDLLRVKAEFPINLWPNAVQAYHRWIRDAIAENKPYDAFARELLTSSGSNFRAPPVNFYRAMQDREPGGIAKTVALTFMGRRLEMWPENQQSNMEAFFSRVAYKKTAEWKEEIVYLNPEPVEAFEATLPDGTTARLDTATDPRVVFADWLIRDDNPWFARNAVNRAWGWLMGRGIIHEADDIRPDNPPANPELLAYLEKEFVQSGYNMRRLYRLILNSGTYQQSSIPRSADPEAEALFAHYIPRRLEAETLIDALCWLLGSSERYSSLIPEPFTFIPENQRTIMLADGSISSQFLEMFGRPTRDTGLLSERNDNPTDAQRLHLLNSSHIQKKIERSSWLTRTIKQSRGKNPVLVEGIYLNVLSRRPTPDEKQTALAYFQTEGIKRKDAANDLVWALINTKEFLYRH